VSLTRGNDPAVTIRNVRAGLDDWELSSYIIVAASARFMDIQLQRSGTGAHIIHDSATVSCPKMVLDHWYTRETVRQ